MIERVLTIVLGIAVGCLVLMVVILIGTIAVHLLTGTPIPSLRPHEVVVCR